MARYDVYANPDTSERKLIPYLLDVQNDYIDELTTRIVIPLRKEATFGPRARDLNPVLAVGADNVVLDTATMGAIPVSELRKPVANIRDQHALVIEALDTLFGAY